MTKNELRQAFPLSAKSMDEFRAMPLGRGASITHLEEPGKEYGPRHISYWLDQVDEGLERAFSVLPEAETLKGVSK